MDTFLEGIFSFFVPLFIVLLHYWYISLPATGLIILDYIKVKNDSLKRILRIILAFVGLSAAFTLIYYINNN